MTAPLPPVGPDTLAPVDLPLEPSPPRHAFLRWLADIFFSGLITFLPVVATLAAVIWLAKFMEETLGTPLLRFLPGEYNWYGMGIAAFLVFVFILGLMTRLWIVRTVVRWVGTGLKSIPFVKTVYGGLKDMSDFIFKPADEHDNRAVVMVTLPGGWKQIGLVTRTEYDDLPLAFQEEMRLPADPSAHVPEEPTKMAACETQARTMVAVYFPFSYQIGGFSYFVDSSTVRPIPGMSVEDVMRYSVMAWMSGKPKA